MQKRGQTLFALSAVILIYAFATSIMQYNLALFTDSLASNYTLFGLVMGLPWFFSLLTDMPVGAFADRFGRKRTIVLGLLGLGASGFLFYMVSGLFQLFWALVIFGAFEGLLTVAGMASVIATSPAGKENQFIGGYSGASAFGYFIGPLAGGVAVAWFGDRTPFLIFGAVCFAAAGIAYIFIREHNRRAQETFFRAVGNIFTKDRLYSAELKEFFSAGRLSVFVGFFMLLVGMWSEFIWAMEPLFAKSINTSPVMGGVILSAFIAPFAFLDYPVGRWIDRTQKRFFSILLGLVLGGGGIVLFSFTSHPYALISLAALVSTGFVFFYVAVNGLFDSFSDRHRRGYMTGVWQSAEDIGFVIGPIFGGVAADFLGLRGAFLIFGATFLLSILWVLWERKNIRKYERRPA
ncbi:MAG: MFS transporter [Candidatus Liptonbacteria bacterium]|nr:MFS transporter [Candidatus Liptonbacteria bacterium]